MGGQIDRMYKDLTACCVLIVYEQGKNTAIDRPRLTSHGWVGTNNLITRAVVRAGCMGGGEYRHGGVRGKEHLSFLKHTWYVACTARRCKIISSTLYQNKTLVYYHTIRKGKSIAACCAVHMYASDVTMLHIICTYIHIAEYTTTLLLVYTSYIFFMYLCCSFHPQM